MQRIITLSVSEDEADRVIKHYTELGIDAEIAGSEKHGSDHIVRLKLSIHTDFDSLPLPMIEE